MSLSGATRLRGSASHLPMLVPSTAHHHCTSPVTPSEQRRQGSFLFGQTLTEAQWGEVPLGTAASVERRQRGDAATSEASRHHHHHRHRLSRRRVRSDAEHARLAPHDIGSSGGGCNVVKANHSANTGQGHTADDDGVLRSGPPPSTQDSTASSLVDDMVATERHLRDVMHRVNDIAHGQSNALRSDPLKSISKETLLARHAANIPPRFLLPLREEVDRLRALRQDNLRQWWLGSITDVAERVSHSMPLCRGGPPPPARASDTGAQARCGDVQCSSSGGDGSANAAQLPSPSASSVDKSRMAAAALLLSGHPAFRSSASGGGGSVAVEDDATRRLMEVTQTVCGARDRAAGSGSKQQW